MFRSMRISSLLDLAALLAASLLSTGCTPSDRQQTAPVRGIVTLDGKALVMGNVVFTPENGRLASATIREGGSYELGTYEEADGAILGPHKVAVQARPRLEGESEGAPLVPRYGPSLIPEAYGDPESSELRYEVVDGANVIDIRLSGDGPGG